MTIQVELSSKAEMRLAAEASAQGLAPETYAGRLLQEVLEPAAESSKKLSVEQFHAMLDALGKGSEDLPPLPTENFSRESFYQDRA